MQSSCFKLIYPGFLILQKVNLQLKVIQERNAEILQHLAEAKAVAAEGEFSLPSHLSESITKAQDISQRVSTVL